MMRKLATVSRNTEIILREVRALADRLWPYDDEEQRFPRTDPQAPDLPPTPDNMMKLLAAASARLQAIEIDTNAIRERLKDLADDPDAWAQVKRWTKRS